MYRNDKISKAEKDSLQNTDLGLNVHRESHKEGLAPYTENICENTCKNGSIKIPKLMVPNTIYIPMD